MFVFPNWHSRFYFINNKSGGGKRGVSVARSHAYPHCQLRQLQRADPVYTSRIVDGKARHGFLQNARAFTERQMWVRVVAQLGNFLPGVVITHPPLKTYVRTRACRQQFLPQLRGVKYTVGKLK